MAGIAVIEVMGDATAMNTRIKAESKTSPSSGFIAPRRFAGAE